MGVLEQNRRRRMFLGQEGNQLTYLIIFLAIIFVAFKFIYVIYLLSEMNPENYRPDVHNWLTLPASLDQLITRPWTILTYSFMHFKVWHALGNLLWIWAFGFILQDLAGNNKIIPLFIYGALAGGIIYLLSFNLLPVFKPSVPVSTLEGASAGVMAIAVAATTLAPNYRLFPMINGGIPLWVLTLVFLVIDFASIDSTNPGGHLAHLAGAVIGFVFIRQLRRGHDWGAWMNNFASWLNNLFNPDKPKNRTPVKDQMFYKSKGEPYKKIPQITQQRIDAILDKINQKGVHLLTEEEKEILKRAGEGEA